MIQAATATGSYVPLSPARLLDTRASGITVDGLFKATGALGAAGSRTVTVTGRGGVPASGVAAVLLNVTAVTPTSSTYLTVYPAGEARPNASNLNLVTGKVAPNLVAVKVGASGGVTIWNSAGSVNVVADVAGYFPVGQSYVPLSPGRLMDTRASGVTVDGVGKATGAVASTTVRTLQVTGRYGIPSSGVDAVVLNVTGVQPTSSTYATVWPTGSARPNSSNLNLLQGEVRPNLVVAKVGTGGQLSFANAVGTMHMIADVAGWIPSGTSFTPLAPGRLLDTRSTGVTVDGQGAKGGAIPAGGTRDVTVVGRHGIPATGVAAVVLNVTGVAPTASTVVTAYPSNEARPTASNLNLAKGEVRPNLVVAKVSPTGTVRLHNAMGSVHLLADVAGWFATPPPPAPVSITTTSPLPAGTVGTAYSVTLAATGGTAPYGWTTTSGTLPAGLSLSAAGVLSGTPTSAATSTFTVRASDSTTPALTATASFTLAVGPGGITVTTTSLGGATIGAAYSQTLSATGGQTPYGWSVVTGSLPAGLSLNASTGAITGTPTGPAGTVAFTVRVTDSSAPTAKTDDQALSVVVVAPPPVTVTTTSLTAATAQSAYSLTLAATGGTQPYTWSLVLGSIPAGMNLSSAGVLSGTPTTPGTSTFTVKVVGGATSDEQQLTLVVNPAPLAITTTSLSPADLNQPYEATLVATGGITPYTWTLSAGSLPAGLALTAAGVVTGTPTVGGTSSFTVQVSDSAGSPVTDTQALSLQVLVPPVAVWPATMPEGFSGVAYDQVVSATGGASASCVLTVSSGSLPGGLALQLQAGTYRVSGTPLAAGTSAFTVSANCGGTVGSRAYSLKVNPKPLAFTTTALSPTLVGDLYDESVGVEGGTGPYTWSITSGAFPAGLTLSTTTGAVRGTAPAVFTEGTATVRVTDSTGTFVSRVFTVYVNEFFLDPAYPNGTVGVAYTSEAPSEDGAAPIAWAPVGTLPPGLTLGAGTGLLTGTPTTAGTSVFAVQGTDGGGLRAKAPSTVVIHPLGAPVVISTTSLPAGSVDQHALTPLVATGGHAPYRWSVSAGALPPGLALHRLSCATPGSGGFCTSLNGWPTEPGTWTFTLTVSDDGQVKASRAYTLTVAPAALVITTTHLPLGVAGAALNATLTARGGVAPYAWSLASGTMPAGLTLSAGGLVTGTPTVAATTTLNLRVTDSAATTATTALSLVVKAPAAATAPGAGWAHTCAVFGGTVRCWGSNWSGELGVGTSGVESHSPLEVSGLTAVKAVAAGESSTCAVLIDKRVACWGANWSGQIGDGSTTQRLVPVFTGVTNAVAVSVGDYHACALLDTGQVSCWGDNSAGQVGVPNVGSSTSIKVPTLVPGLSGVTAVSAGQDSTCTSQTSGAVKCWGDNDDGELGNGTFTASTTPVTAIASGAIGVSTSSGSTCAVLTGGAVSCWGLIDTATPTTVAGVGGASSVALGWAYACAQTGGTVTCWGEGYYGQRGDGSMTWSSGPTTVTGVTTAAAGSLAVGELHACVVVSGGSLRCWGANDSGQVGNGLPSVALAPVTVSGLGAGVASVATGGEHACAVSGGVVSCWGSGEFGQLGDGRTDTASPTPVTVNGLANVVQVVTGSRFSCARRSTGTVACWGVNWDGQLGDGSFTDSATPVDAVGIADATLLTAGSDHVCAIRSGGLVSCWGSNWDGQLGDPSMGQDGIPELVPGVSGATSVSAGRSHTCAVVASAVTCWGDNSVGQIGDGTQAHADSPTPVPGLSGVSAVAAGGVHTCALLTSGAARCWGGNGEGQLGVGDDAAHLTPTPVAGLTTATQLAAGETNTCARLSSGGVQCWGAGYLGLLGSGSDVQSSVPRSVAALTGAAQVSVGDASVCARTGAEVVCWGSGYRGSLGNGSSGTHLTPQRVMGT